MKKLIPVTGSAGVAMADEGTQIPSAACPHASMVQDITRGRKNGIGFPDEVVVKT